MECDPRLLMPPVMASAPPPAEVHPVSATHGWTREAVVDIRPCPRSISISLIHSSPVTPSEDEALRMHQHPSISASVLSLFVPAEISVKVLCSVWSTKNHPIVLISRHARNLVLQRDLEPSECPLDLKETVSQVVRYEKNLCKRPAVGFLRCGFFRPAEVVAAAQPRFPTVSRLLRVLCLKFHLRRVLSKTDDFSGPKKHIWRRSGGGVGAAESRGRRSG